MLVELQSVVLDNTDFTCADLGSPSNTVTLTVTDVNGNANTCTAAITVEDDLAPVVTNCPTNMTFPASIHRMCRLRNMDFGRC